MKRYEKYKPTGIQWLPEIPEYWEAVKIKYCFNQRSEKGFPNEPILCATQSRGVIPQTLYENRVVVVNKGFEGLKLVKVGDFVISLRSFQGGIEYAYYQGIISSAYTILSPQKESSSPYFKYLFKSHPFIQLLQTCVTGIREGQNINYSVLGNSFIPIPPIPEQNKIVAYLDKRITLIDNCKCQRERELQTLNELKQAEIASVVTRGLNPDVPMKDSGQIQFGKVPAHWDTIKLKYCFNQRSEKGFPNEPVLCATQSKGVIPQSLYENRVVVVNKGFDGLKLVKVGDFVISLRSFQGGIEYAYYQGIISSAYTILTPKDERNSKYFKYLFKSHPFIQLLQTCVTGIREGQNINYSVLGNNFIPVPPIEEQNAIVEYIESKTSKIDTMIEALKAEIDRLTEYKQRLISDVVTGQIDVRGEQI